MMCRMPEESDCRRVSEPPAPSAVIALIEAARRDRSVTLLGEAVNINQLPRTLVSMRKQRKMPPFPDVERIAARLDGVSTLELVEAFAYDAGVSLEPFQSDRVRWLLARVAGLPRPEQDRLWQIVDVLVGRPRVAVGQPVDLRRLRDEATGTRS